MNTPGPARHVVEQARHRLRRLALTRQMHAVASGRTHTLAVDVVHDDLDASVLQEVTAGMEPHTPPLLRLTAALHRSGTTAAVLDGLAAASANVKRARRCAKVAGGLRMEDAVALLGLLVGSADAQLAEASARALGRIGGIRSAEALLQGVQRSGPHRRLSIELAKGAPDLFLEVAIGGPTRTGVIASVALAAGLRRRTTAVGPLIWLLMTGTRRQRVISCRALGWIGSKSAIPMLTSALDDREWRVRAAAAKALASLKVRPEQPHVEALLADRHPSVRRAGIRMIRLTHAPQPVGGA
jgi:HEAT repeat protein